MSAAPQRSGASDLGDGFAVAKKAGAEPAVVASPLARAGIVALMSTAPANLRSDFELSQWAKRAGMPTRLQITQLHQAHGADIIQAPLPNKEAEGDGLWAEDTDVALTVRIADCAPIWLAEIHGRRFALLHAGWRGVASNIVPKALKLLAGVGSEPAHMLVAVGPHLQACCFEVGPEVAQRFSAWPHAILPASCLRVQPKRNDSAALDLTAVVHQQLVETGVRGENVFISTACTRCNVGLFHSYRRNGAGGPLMAAFAWRAV